MANIIGPPIDPVAQGMKKTEVNIPLIEGFPLESETIKWMQESYTLLSVLAEIAGNKAIIKGCEVNGDNVSPGYIYIDGELLYFTGGQVQDTLVIVTEEIKREWEDGILRTTYSRRHAEFGSGVTQYNWADFKRAYPLTSALVVDEIKMWAGSVDNLPAGWHLCNGQNGTVDLRGRFVVGHHPDDPDYDTIGNTGGEKTHTLTEAEMPEHNHTGTALSAGAHDHDTDSTQGMVKETGSNTTAYAPDNSSNEIDIINAYPLPSDGSHTHSLSINDRGGDQPHENRPPYYTLAFIQFKGV